eukprot:5103158-Alexandrium_andersonii.AAC.1
MQLPPVPCFAAAASRSAPALEAAATCAGAASACLCPRAHVCGRAAPGAAARSAPPTRTSHEWRPEQPRLRAPRGPSDAPRDRVK